MVQIHATAITLDAHAILIRGKPGSGKSDLALRMIDSGAKLIADDRCNLDIREDRIIVSAPETIFGLLEVRGLGVIKTSAEPCVPLALIVDLVNPGEVARMPEDALCKDFCKDNGPVVPVIRLAAFEASTPAKVRIALAGVLDKLEKQP